jgi:UDP-glucose 4-epimerase
MRRICVTGGAGFIGSNIVRGCLERGDDVRVLDNLSTGRRANLEGLSVELIEGDIRDADACRRAVAGCDVVFHEAALPSVTRSVADPILANAVNVDGTLNVLVAARDAGVRRVVFAGSSSAYGETVELPKREDMAPAPISPYAVAKVACEHYGAVFNAIYGLEFVTLRYFNVFGPRQDPKSEYAAVIPRFCTAMLKGEAPTIFGDGLQTRDFCYVDNVVQANLLAADAPAAPGHVYNVACAERVSLLDVVAAINELLGTTIAPSLQPARTGDIRDSLASIDAARRDLGYTASIRFLAGLKLALAHYRALVEAGRA